MMTVMIGLCRAFLGPKNLLPFNEFKTKLGEPGRTKNLNKRWMGCTCYKDIF